jgi:hypothetical protein
MRKGGYLYTGRKLRAPNSSYNFQIIDFSTMKVFQPTIESSDVKTGSSKQQSSSDVKTGSTQFTGVYGVVAQCERSASFLDKPPPFKRIFDTEFVYLPKGRRRRSKRSIGKARDRKNAAQTAEQQSAEFAEQQVLDFIVPMAIGHFINKDLPEEERESRLIQFEAFRRFLFWIFRAQSLGEMLHLCCGLYTTLTGKSAIG